MFKILNEASSEEIAIITAVVEVLNNKDIKKEISISHWAQSSKNNICQRTLWKQGQISNWEKSSRVY